MLVRTANATLELAAPSVGHEGAKKLAYEQFLKHHALSTHSASDLAVPKVGHETAKTFSLEQFPTHRKPRAKEVGHHQRSMPRA